MEGEVVVAAVCNDRQAGGGQLLAPGACITDGLLDIVVILIFPIADVAQVIQEMREPQVPAACPEAASTDAVLFS